jgi:hypothetical protein
LAEVHAFDPFIPSNWYSISNQDIIALKVEYPLCYSILFLLSFSISILFFYAPSPLFKNGAYILDYYNGSKTKALLDVFPNIGLQFEKLTGNYSHLTQFSFS